MAIQGNYVTSSNNITGATFRIQSIWGSKKEGWNAWVGVFVSSLDVEPLEVFSVSAPYVDGQNPFSALYDAIGGLSFVENPVHDAVPVDVVPVDVVLVEEIKESIDNLKPKKRKSAK